MASQCSKIGESSVTFVFCVISTFRQRRAKNMPAPNPALCTMASPQAESELLLIRNFRRWGGGGEPKRKAILMVLMYTFTYSRLFYFLRLLPKVAARHGVGGHRSAHNPSRQLLYVFGSHSTRDNFCMVWTYIVTGIFSSESQCDTIPVCLRFSPSNCIIYKMRKLRDNKHYLFIMLIS